jgi:hypothetical protein
MPTSRIADETYGFLKCFCSSDDSSFNFHDDDAYKSLGFPRALFLISREFRETAMEIFYSKNTFAVSMIGPDPPHSSRRPWIASSLQLFSKGCLGFFTSLIIEFRALNLAFAPDQPSWNNWLETNNFLSKEANLAILDLELRTFYPPPWDYDLPTYYQKWADGIFQEDM